jgi:hypothetical protein
MRHCIIAIVIRGNNSGVVREIKAKQELINTKNELSRVTLARNNLEERVNDLAINKEYTSRQQLIGNLTGTITPKNCYR